MLQYTNAQGDLIASRFVEIVHQLARLNCASVSLNNTSVCSAEWRIGYPK